MKKKTKIRLILLIIIFILGTILGYIIYTNYKLQESYDDKLFPKTYINDIEVSNLKLKNIDKVLDNLETELLTRKLILKGNNKDYTYTLKDLNISINKEEVRKKMIKDHDKLDVLERLKEIRKPSKKKYKYEIIYKSDDILNFVNNLKKQVDTESSQGGLIMTDTRQLYYQESTSSYYLDSEDAYNKIVAEISNEFSNLVINLYGSSDTPTDNVLLKTINTKVASYSTNYNAWISRGRNLENALNYVDGAIIYSGETFSFFNYAGPYNKRGYVYYDNVIGNGVCQIASTIYNAALIGGLEIVERYQHANELTYVPGGQDATVASNGNWSSLDFKFKNTYDYPIYISAYYGGGVATIDFWSNENAKKGKEYYVESQKVGYKAYRTFLHTLENGQEISRDFIAYTYYTK